MHYEILVEDASGKIALKAILEKILGPNGQDHTYRIISYKGIGHIPKNLKERQIRKNGFFWTDCQSYSEAMVKASTIFLLWLSWSWTWMIKTVWCLNKKCSIF